MCADILGGPGKYAGIGPTTPDMGLAYHQAREKELDTTACKHILDVVQAGGRYLDSKETYAIETWQDGGYQVVRLPFLKFKEIVFLKAETISKCIIDMNIYYDIPFERWGAENLQFQYE